MKRMLALVLALIVAFACVGCGQSETTAATTETAAAETATGETATTEATEEAAPVKDTLVIAIETEGNDFDPQNSGLNISSSGVTRNVYDPLVRNNESGEVYGVLATDWQWENDGLAIRFFLREDVYFTNGEPFTADDIVFSYKERFPTSANGKSETTFDFENIEVVNDYEVVIPLKKVASDALNQLTHPKYSIMNREAVEAAGDLAGIQPVGTGAYVLADWVQGDKIVLKANENYWGEQPYFKEVTLRIIKENSQAEIELESGNVDACIFYNGNNDVVRVMNGEIEGLQTIKLFNAVNALRFNYKKEWAQNENVRKALNYAVDRVSLTMADSNNMNTVAYQLGIPGQACYIDEYNTNPNYPYDPEKAIELLKQEGYYGNLTLELYTDTGIAGSTDGQLLKNMYEKVGVTLNIHALEAGTVVPLVIAGEEDDCFLGFGISDWTGSILQRFRSASSPSYSPQFENHGTTDVYTAVYEKFLLAEKEQDRDTAVSIMQEAARIENEAALNVPLNSTNIFINCVDNLYVEWYFGDPNFQNWCFK